MKDTAWPVIVRHLSEALGREIVARRTRTQANTVLRWEEATETPSSAHRERLMYLLAALYVLEIETDLADLEEERESLAEDSRKFYGASMAASGRSRGSGGGRRGL